MANNSTHSGFTANSTITLAAGTATAGTSPLKLQSGTNLTSAEAGAIEFDGTDLYITDSIPTRRTLLYADFSNGLSNVTPTFSSITLTNPLTVGNGGTGQTTYTDGQLLIGKTTGNTLAKATLTGTSNQITVTNGSGTITLATPQDIATGSSPTFAGLSLGSGSLSTVGNISLDKTGARDVTVARSTSGAGQNLTIQAGGGQASTNNLAGGDLILTSGISTGTGQSNVRIRQYLTNRQTSSGDNTVQDRAVFHYGRSLTNNTATTIFTMTNSSPNRASGTIIWSIDATDGTDTQTISGITLFASVNKGNVWTTAFTNPSGGTSDDTTAAKAVSAGTITVAWSATSSTTTLSIKVTANSSLTNVTGLPRINYVLINNSDATVTIS